jgi:TPR repeat protein
LNLVRGTPPSFIPQNFCYTFFMRNLTAIFCLTLTLLLGGCVTDRLLKSAGFGGKSNYEQTYTLAKQGNADAQYKLGEMYYYGEGVPQDDKTAVKWYTLAAKQGNARAQNNLGLMYYRGQGVPQDYKTAVKWYTLSAKQGFADAKRFLERLRSEIANQKGLTAYKSGDYATALRELEPLAKQGNADAQSKLGWMYETGGFDQVPFNNKTAVRWYTLAAKQGNAESQFNLGSMYHLGKGVRKTMKLR